MKNEIKFKEYLALLCEIHNRSVSKVLADLYWKILEPFTDEECDEAFKALIHESVYFPKPADLIEALVGKKANAATEAWLEVIGTVRRVGNYQSIRFADLTIHSVIQAMGGWEQLCMMETKDEKWKQKEFERLYEVISSRPGTHPQYLPGTHEMENFRTGWERDPEIVKVGYEGGLKKIKLVR